MCILSFIGSAHSQHPRDPQREPLLSAACSCATLLTECGNTLDHSVDNHTDSMPNQVSDNQRGREGKEEGG